MKKMRGASALPSLLLVLTLSSFCNVSASTKKDQVYIVYLGEHAGEKAEEAILEDHHTLLLSVKSSEEEARASLLYSYKHTLNGFAAILSQEQATKLSERSEVVSAFRSEGRWAPHTTRSWQFRGRAHQSSRRQGMAPVPRQIQRGHHRRHPRLRALAGVEELQRPRARAGAGALERDVPRRRFLQLLVL